MAIIIDTNCFAHVFKRNSDNHEEFKPVLDWILSGKGLIAYGGTKYFEELKKANKYLKILRLFKEQNKVIVGDREEIDKLEERNKELIKDEDFDDPHLPAIAIVTKCMLICSVDNRSIKHVKNNVLYPDGFSCPAYYTGQRNSDLLCDKYVHSCHKPLIKINLANQGNLVLAVDKITEK